MKEFTGLRVSAYVQYIKEYFDGYKEDIVSGHWAAQVITGLEEACREIDPNLRQKDLLLDTIAHGEANDMVARKEAIDKLIALLQKQGFHGTLHIMTEQEFESYLDGLQAKGRIVLR